MLQSNTTVIQTRSSRFVVLASVFHIQYEQWFVDTVLWGVTRLLVCTVPRWPGGPCSSIVDITGSWNAFDLSHNCGSFYVDVKGWLWSGRCRCHGNFSGALSNRRHRFEIPGINMSLHWFHRSKEATEAVNIPAIRRESKSLAMQNQGATI